MSQDVPMPKLQNHNYIIPMTAIELLDHGELIKYKIVGDKIIIQKPAFTEA